MFEQQLKAHQEKVQDQQEITDEELEAVAGGVNDVLSIFWDL